MPSLTSATLFPAAAKRESPTRAVDVKTGMDGPPSVQRFRRNPRTPRLRRSDGALATFAVERGAGVVPLRFVVEDQHDPASSRRLASASRAWYTSRLPSMARVTTVRAQSAAYSINSTVCRYESHAEADFRPALANSLAIIAPRRRSRVRASAASLEIARRRVVVLTSNCYYSVQL